MTTQNGSQLRLPFSRFQKALVFVGGGAADVAHSCQFADIHLPGFSGGCGHPPLFLFLVRDILHNILYLTVQYPAKHLDRMGADTLVSL